MKITKAKLRQIIREELQRFSDQKLHEEASGAKDFTFIGPEDTRSGASGEEIQEEWREITSDLGRTPGYRKSRVRPRPGSGYLKYKHQDEYGEHGQDGNVVELKFPVDIRGKEGGYTPSEVTDLIANMTLDLKPKVERLLKKHFGPSAKILNYRQDTLTDKQAKQLTDPRRYDVPGDWRHRWGGTIIAKVPPRGLTGQQVRELMKLTSDKLDMSLVRDDFDPLADEPKFATEMIIAAQKEKEERGNTGRLKAILDQLRRYGGFPTDKYL